MKAYKTELSIITSTSTHVLFTEHDIKRISLIDMKDFPITDYTLNKVMETVKKITNKATRKREFTYIEIKYFNEKYEKIGFERISFYQKGMTKNKYFNLIEKSLRDNVKIHNYHNSHMFN